MKRLSILFTLLLTLSIILTTGCDNGSVTDSSMSKSSGLVEVSLTVDAPSTGVQKSLSIEGVNYTYQYKAIPQWSQDWPIHGRVDNWTTIKYSGDNMGLGYFTAGQWVFYVRILNNGTPIFEGQSAVTTINTSQVSVTVSVAKIIQDATPGVVSITVTAPTIDENTDSLTVSWTGTASGSGVATPDVSGGITTFTYTKNNLPVGIYTFTLSHNNAVAKGSAIAVDLHQGEMAIVTGHLDTGEWKLGYITVQLHTVTVERHNWGTPQEPKYFGTVDIEIDSAVPGDRVSVFARPVSSSGVRSISITSGGTPVAYSRNGELYSFIMPDGDVDVYVTFENVNSSAVDVLLFKTMVRALYDENLATVESFGQSGAPGVGDHPITVGDVKLWYSTALHKICWYSDAGEVGLGSGSLAGLFGGCDRLTAISMANIITTYITDMSGMFEGCTGLTSLDLTGFDASGATDMSEMFQDCTGLTSITLTGFTANTTSGVNMAGLFKNCSSLTTLTDLSSLNTSKATSLAGMFQGCSGLTGLNLTNFNASSATDMSEMFQDCTGLTSITLTGFTANTTSGVNMAGLFKNCSNLTTLTGLSSLNTSKATSLAGMFQGCSGLTGTLNLTNFNASSATDISYMFQGCTGLSKITLTGFTLNTTSGVNMAGMFKDCTNLYGVNGILDLSSFDTTQATDMSYMFCACKKLKGINFGSNFHTANVTDMSYMFSSVESGTAGGSSNKMNLTSLDVSGFDTSSVTNMSHMFYMCSNSNLTTLAVSGFDTSNVTDMSYMFGCWRDAPSYVTAFDLSGWDFSKVTTVNRMFDRCQFAVITFPSHTMLSKIEDVLYWFSHCFAVHRADFETIVGSWDFTGNAGAAALFADTTNGDDPTEREPSNRIMGSDMATSSDFGTRQGYSTYNVNTNPVTTLYVGGDMSKIKNQRLTTVAAP